VSRGPWLEADGLTFRYADGDSYQCADVAEVIATCEQGAATWDETAARFEWEAGREWYSQEEAAYLDRMAAACRVPRECRAVARDGAVH
jgi:hypothetical protein